MRSYKCTSVFYHWELYGIDPFYFRSLVGCCPIVYVVSLLDQWLEFICRVCYGVDDLRVSVLLRGLCAVSDPFVSGEETLIFST
jgi:hypothetical protein